MGNVDRYITLKKILAFIAAIGLWAVSMYFSYQGFKFDSGEILWFGIVLALVVTVVELVFNTKIYQLNPTLFVAGLVCYAYGIYTNITGFYVLQHGSLDGFITGGKWFIPVMAGMVSEVLPEALFAWSVGAFANGDLLGNIADMFSGKPEQQQNQRRGQSGQPSKSYGNQTGNRPLSRNNGQIPPANFDEAFDRERQLRGGENRMPQNRPIGASNNQNEMGKRRS